MSDRTTAPETRTEMHPEVASRRVALVVLCEAEGVDDSDAAAGAQIALSRLIREHADPAAQHHVGSSMGPACAACGARPALDSEGLVGRHIWCETWSPEAWAADNPGERPQPVCEGSGQPPLAPTDPVIGFVRADGVPMFARVHTVMEAGTAFGNGYLWARPTAKAFR